MTRHADVVAVNRDPTTFSSAGGTNIPDLTDDAEILKQMLSTWTRPSTPATGCW